MRTEQEIRARLENFLKDNPRDWVYRTKNEGLKALYETTVNELNWVLSEGR